MTERFCGVPSPSHRCQRRRGTRAASLSPSHTPGRRRREEGCSEGGRVSYLVAGPALVLHGGDQQAGAAARLGARRLAQAHHRSHALAAALEPQDRQVPAEDLHLTGQPHRPDSRLPAARPLEFGATRRTGLRGPSREGCPWPACVRGLWDFPEFHGKFPVRRVECPCLAFPYVF